MAVFSAQLTAWSWSRGGLAIPLLPPLRDYHYWEQSHTSSLFSAFRQSWILNVTAPTSVSRMKGLRTTVSFLLGSCESSDGIKTMWLVAPETELVNTCCLAPYFRYVDTFTAPPSCNIFHQHINQISEINHNAYINLSLPISSTRAPRPSLRVWPLRNLRTLPTQYLQNPNFSLHQQRSIHWASPIAILRLPRNSSGAQIRSSSSQAHLSQVRHFSLPRLSKNPFSRTQSPQHSQSPEHCHRNWLWWYIPLFCIVTQPRWTRQTRHRSRQTFRPVQHDSCTGVLYRDSQGYLKCEFSIRLRNEEGKSVHRYD